MTEDLEDRIAAKVMRAMNAKSEETFGKALDAIEEFLLPQLSKNYAAMSVYALSAARVIEDVRICDLGPKEALILWEKLDEGNSLAAYAGALKPRLKAADKSLGFKGLEDFVERLPKTPQSNHRNVEVTDEIHQEALKAIRWAETETQMLPQTLTALEVSLRVPFRRGELASLRRVDVDLRVGVVMLPTSKTGRRSVPLTPRAVELLRRQIDSLPASEEYVWPSQRSGSGHATGICLGHAWRTIRGRYCRGATDRTVVALQNVRYHDLRHLTCTQALSHGAAWHDVQKAMGHSTEAMTARYAHLRDIGGAKSAVTLVESVLDGTKTALDLERDARLGASRWDESRPIPTEGLLLVSAEHLALLLPHLDREVG